MKKEMSEKEFLLRIMRSKGDPEKYFLRFYDGAERLAAAIYRDVLPGVGIGW